MEEKKLESLIKKALCEDGQLFKATGKAQLTQKLTKVFRDVDERLALFRR